MSKQTELVDKLKMLGFSEYASRAYLAIVKLKEGTAPTIADESKVPKAKIYEVLDDLYKKGFVGKDEDSKPAVFIAHNPLQRFQQWMEQFTDLSEYLESIFDTSGPTREYGFYTVGNFSEKLDARDYIYIFEQFDEPQDSLFSRFFEGKITNYYNVGGPTSSLLAITEKNMVILLEKESRVQFIAIEDLLFNKFINMLFALTPVNRAITEEMESTARGEKILYIDSIISTTGAITGQDGNIWVTEERLFIRTPGKSVYARPISTVSAIQEFEDGSLNLVISLRDGSMEESQIFTYSDPAIIINLITFLRDK